MGAGEQVHGVRRRGGLAAALMVLAAVGAGCGGPAEPWTQAAQEYADAYLEAWTVGYTNLGAFYDDAVRVDQGWLDHVESGRAQFLQHLRSDFQSVPNADDADRVTRESPVYLSATGVIQPVWIESAAGFRLVWRHEVATGGISDVESHPSVAMGNLYGHQWWGDMQDAASGYVDPWSDGDQGAVLSHYAPGATVVDSLLGLELVGPEKIAAAAGEAPERGGLAAAALAELPGDGGPAAYSIGHYASPPGPEWAVDGLVLLLSLPGDCPGSVASVIRFDDQQLITDEERYHRIDDLERCTDPGQRPPVWWDSIAIPDPQAFTRTGDLPTPAGRIALWNATPQRNALLEWALQRFADLLMTPPTPTSTSFVPSDDDPWTTYGFVRGSGDLVLPASAPTCAARGCDTWPAAERAAALTELAHLWLAEPARASTRTEFAEVVGQPWDDPDAEGDVLLWAGDSDPAVTTVGLAAVRAADTLAWGLMDQAYPLPDTLESLPCGQLAADFLLLAHAAPATTCPADGR